MSSTLLTHAVVVTMDTDRRVFSDGYVLMTDGLIAAVGTASQAPIEHPDTEVRDLGGRYVVMPGLVNVHDHLSLTVVRGGLDELDRLVMGTKMFDALRVIDGPASYDGARSSIAELLLGGVTTTACDEFGHPDRPAGVLEACREMGIRTVFGRATMDSTDETVNSQTIPPDFRETPEDAIARVAELRREYDSDLVSVHPSAVSTMRVSTEMMQALGGYALGNDRILMLHMGADRDEQEECQRRYGKLLVEYMDDIGALESRVLLAHATWTEDQEIPRLVRRDVAVAHCPESNAHEGDRVSRVAPWLSAGVRVGVGTDGANSGNAQNLWETARLAVYFQKMREHDGLYGSAELGLELMTLGGARALYLEDQVGALLPGMAADVVCVDVDRPSLAPRGTILSNLVYANDRAAVRHVYVAGEERVRDGELVGYDVQELAARTTTASARVMAASGFEADVTAKSRFTWVD
jgi:cytosine/adenosine deaminase-related metal-dependent hydrolase